MEKGAATSQMRAGPRASRPIIDRRVGSEIATRTLSSLLVNDTEPIGSVSRLL